jgi:hypothetical protein
LALRAATARLVGPTPGLLIQWTEMNDNQARQALREAIRAAIEEIGMEAFKRCSMFPLTNRSPAQN